MTFKDRVTQQYFDVNSFAAVYKNVLQKASMYESHMSQQPKTETA